MAFLADERLADGKAVDAEMLRNLVQFMRMFAEQCHHGKEEQYLFPALTKNPVPHTRRVLKTLESEHRRVHTLTNGLAQAVAGYVLDPVAGREPVATIFRDIAAFYPRHIWKEEYLLFPIAKQVLSPSEQEEIGRGFSDIEPEIGSDVHHAF